MDALISPSTRDYAGVTTMTLANAVYLRLETPLGSWWADPTLGSKLHTLQREKDTPRVRTLAVQYVEQALAPIVADGRATSVAVTSVTGEQGWLVLLIEVVDASGARQHFKHPVKVS
ncbi:phage GP46 family protein [Pandoraea captiosa]|uniref:Phage GP46 family protein n=1 Tax=Pandoraea captiosa TaxID=2508302 RepID=A0A5E4ZGW1_9BURK|nr:phage GP46 family protein [Pandoraea captiosa]VVE59752.1 phage GP46 family protein [Pandoraea captiosa]